MRLFIIFPFLPPSKTMYNNPMNHVVKIKDSYLLKVHPVADNKILQTILQYRSVADWLNGNGDTLAFYLADNNSNNMCLGKRGNIYPTLPVHLPQYWNFSWPNMGTKDFPINYKSVNHVTVVGPIRHGLINDCEEIK